MTGGKGPWTVRYSFLNGEQTSYNIATANDNYWFGALKLVGIGMLLPEDYDIEVPEIPKETRKQQLENKDREIIKVWMEKTQNAMYKGLQKFIAEEGKKGGAYL